MEVKLQICGVRWRGHSLSEPNREKGERQSHNLLAVAGSKSRRKTFSLLPACHFEKPGGDFLNIFSTPLSRFSVFLLALLESVSFVVPLNSNCFVFPWMSERKGAGFAIDEYKRTSGNGALSERAARNHVQVLEVFTTGDFKEISLNNWITRLPPEMVTTHLHLDPADISKISADAGVYILPR